MGGASLAGAWKTRIRALLTAIDKTWAQVMGDQVVVSGTSLMTNIIIGRAFGKSWFGMYALGYSIIIVLFEIQASLIAAPYIVKCQGMSKDDSSRYTGSVLILFCALAMVSSLCLVLSGRFLPKGYGLDETAAICPPLALIIGAVLLRELARRVCFARQEVSAVLLLDVLASVIQIGGLLLLARSPSRSVTGAFLVMGLSSGVVGALWVAMWRKQLVYSMSHAVATLKEHTSFGTWVLSGNVAFLLAQQMYPWYLALFDGVEATGTLAACLGILAFLNPLMTAVGNMLGPKTATAAAEGVWKLWRLVAKTTAVLAATTGLLTVCIILFGEKLVVLIYGGQYAGNSLLLSLLAIGLLVSNSSLALGFGFWAIGRPDVNCKINLIALALTATVGLLLVNNFGVLGMAYGSLLSNAVVAGTRFVVFTRMVVRYTATDRVRRPYAQSNRS